MKYLIFIILIGLLACKPAKQSNIHISDTTYTHEYINIDSLLRAYHVKGAVLILSDGIFYSNDTAYAQLGTLPASTFKIATSIIALEMGLVDIDTTVFRWDGTPRYLKSWESDLSLSEAFKYSCVPCYQKVARSIGVDSMNSFLAKLDYSGMDVSDTNIDMFWLRGKSKISQYQQIDFLKRLQEGKLPISSTTTENVQKLMIHPNKYGYNLKAKTGWAANEDESIGWFVGFLEDEKDIYYFATRLEPKAGGDTQTFLKARKEITMEVLNKLKNR